MRKRIRKKLNIGEFRETGFEITWKPQEVSEADFDKFIQEFLDAIEARGLVFGGGCSSEDSWEGVIARKKRFSSPDAADMEFVSDWFKSRTDIKEFAVGHEIDLWFTSDCCCSTEA
jgi:uncharacterized protein YggL (DUF469 family)